MWFVQLCSHVLLNNPYLFKLLSSVELLFTNERSNSVYSFAHNCRCASVVSCIYIAMMNSLPLSIQLPLLPQFVQQITKKTKFEP